MLYYRIGLFPRLSKTTTRGYYLTPGNYLGNGCCRCKNKCYVQTIKI